MILASIDKTALETLLEKYNSWMGIATVSVAIGILGEYVALFIFEKEARHNKRKLAVSILFGMMVLGGVVGEYLAGEKLSQTANKIQQVSDLEVARLNNEAAQARKTAAELRKTTAELQKTTAFAEASVIFFRARDGEGQAFDSVVRLANNLETPDNLRVSAQSTLEVIEKDARYQQQGSGCPTQRPKRSVLFEKLKSRNPGDLNLALGCLDAGMIAYLFPWQEGEIRATDFALSPRAMEEIRATYPALDALFEMMCHDRDLRIRARAFHVFQNLVSAGWPSQRGPMTVLDNEGNTRWWRVHRREYIP